MKRILFFAAVSFVLVSCSGDRQFTLTGSIADAAGKMLYLEYAGLLGNRVLDSVKLSEKGTFKFKEAAPEYPDFYSLRLDNKSLIFAVDSTETIHVEADCAGFSQDYRISGSEASNSIQDLRKSAAQISRKISALETVKEPSLRRQSEEDLEREIKLHKEKAQKLVLDNPQSTAAYFAIYQQVNGRFLFSPYVKADQAYINAVATAYHYFMPNYVRSKNLYNWAMDGIRAAREEKERAAWKELEASAGKGYIDIVLPDSEEQLKKLSDLQGKVVLLDFSSYEMEGSVNYVFELRALYNKYRGRGFEIYQVAVARNRLLWEASVEELPWICVRDGDGRAASWYNVSTLPTLFLMDRGGNIVGRFDSLKDVDAQIGLLL